MITTSGPVLKRLRAATRSAHERLERQLDAVEKFATAAGRSELVRRYHALHAPMHGILQPWLSGISDLELGARCRRKVLERALGGLGLCPILAADLPEVPTPGSRAEALGLLYVMEGSALGGQLILRALASRGVVVNELSFLDPYGAQTRRLWLSFLAILEREVVHAEDQFEAVSLGGIRGFAYAEACLCGTASTQAAHPPILEPPLPLIEGHIQNVNVNPARI